MQAIVFEAIAERFDETAGSQARGRLEMIYGMLEVRLTGREFLADDTFTIAECAAAPGLFYALAFHPWDEPAHPQLTRYDRALAHRPSFAKVIEDARPYRQLFPLPWPTDFDRHHSLQEQVSTLELPSTSTEKSSPRSHQGSGQAGRTLQRP